MQNKVKPVRINCMGSGLSDDSSIKPGSDTHPGASQWLPPDNDDGQSGLAILARLIVRSYLRHQRQADDDSRFSSPSDGPSAPS